MTEMALENSENRMDFPKEGRTVKKMISDSSFIADTKIKHREF